MQSTDHDYKPSPSAWRGHARARQLSSAPDMPDSVSQAAPRRRSIPVRIAKEIAEHPAETAALVTMVIAMMRLLPGRRGWPPASSPAGRLRRRTLLPISLMAALCIISLSGCALFYDPVIPVEPDPASYGREYPENFAEAGRKIAKEQCASCHAIDRQTVSPNPDAPPLNTLLSRYDKDRLADDLIAGNRVGHDGMPAFDFNVIAADSLIAYLESIYRDLGAR
jgi:cytochrome c553